MQPPRVLIVDDDADIRDVVGLLLDEDGFSTTVCATLQHAISVLETESINLLITDRRLSGGDGLDLVRFVLQQSATVIPIILLTAARPAIAPDEHPLIAQADVTVIAKPFDIDQIVNQARRLTEWPGA